MKNKHLGKTAAALLIAILMYGCSSSFTRYNYSDEITLTEVNSMEIREDLFDVEILPSHTDTLRMVVYVDSIEMKGILSAKKIFQNDALYDINITDGKAEVKNSRYAVKESKKAGGKIELYMPPCVKKICVRSRYSNVKINDIKVDTLQIYSEKAKTILKNVKVENPIIRSRRVEITE